MKHVPVAIRVFSDPELVEGQFEGDHAGKYELSQLMYIHPDLVDLSAAALQDIPGSGGRLALGEDAGEAKAELGGRIMRACLDRLCAEAAGLRGQITAVDISPLDYAVVERIWREVSRHSGAWVTARPKRGQREVSPGSRWKPYEFFTR